MPPLKHRSASHNSNKEKTFTLSNQGDHSHDDRKNGNVGNMDRTTSGSVEDERERADTFGLGIPGLGLPGAVETKRKGEFSSGLIYPNITSSTEKRDGCLGQTTEETSSAAWPAGTARLPPPLLSRPGRRRTAYRRARRSTRYPHSSRLPMTRTFWAREEGLLRESRVSPGMGRLLGLGGLPHRGRC